MKRQRITIAAVTSVRLAVVVFSFACLGFIVRERVLKYIRNAIVLQRYVQVNSKPWFEMAICFGPTVSGFVVHDYLAQISDQFEDRYAYSVEYFGTGGPGTGIYQTRFNATMSVDSVGAYREFFANRYNWTDDVFGISSKASAQISQFLSAIKHEVTLGGFHFNHPVVHTDLPFMFRYSMCRNYSYNVSYHESTGGTGKISGDFVHHIYINDTTREELLNSGVANYIDLYVYPIGHFTEFPLIADHIPYRVDFKTHELLNVVGEKTKKVSRESMPCYDGKDHHYVNCLTWCLLRGLLNKTQCIMPMLMLYIYNTTGRMPDATLVPGPLRLDMNWKALYPENASLPWMKDYATMKMCNSSMEFVDMMDLFTTTFYPRGKIRYPLSPNCSRECMPSCNEYRVYMNSAGTKLALDSGDDQQKSSMAEVSHGVSFIHQTTRNRVKESWVYTWNQLFIDISGVLSFLLGMSVIAIHEWCFSLTKWSMEKIGILETVAEQEEEEEWAHEDDEPQSDSGTRNLEPPLLLVQPPSEPDVTEGDTGSDEA